MFLPLNDDAPLPRHFTPHVNWGVIAVCVMIYLVFQSGLLAPADPQFALGYGLIPAVFVTDAYLQPGITHAPTLLTPLTSLFLHGSWMHLIGNMLFLVIFGDNIEKELGPARFIALYLVCGAASGIAFALTVTSSVAPLIGASGAVSAVLGAYLVLHPNVRVFGLLLNVIPVRIPAYWFIGGWFLLQLGHALFDPNRHVAWVAHVAGLVFGALWMLAARHGPAQRG